MEGCRDSKRKKIIEFFNSFTHLIGVILGDYFLVLMVRKCISTSSSYIASYVVYGIFFILMFLTSTFYHGVINEKLKSILRIFDHSSIYLFIAGSYTPFLVSAFSGKLRIILLGLIWALAIAGTIFKFVTYGKYERYKRISLFLYILMGWLAIFMLKPLIENYSWKLLVFLLLGGLSYTIGTIFYKMKNPAFHIVWHFFVLFAAIIHFAGYYTYLI